MSGELILYRTEDGGAEIQLRADDGTVWITQSEIAALFDTSPQNITQHIRAIYGEGEAEESATCKDHLQVRTEGGRQVRRTIKVYSLDIVLAVGYRVRSPRGGQFRQWATTRLREYLVKGFAIDTKRLLKPEPYDYFDELLEKIREIRASKKRFYQKVRDVFSTSIDYDGSVASAKTFFATVQNKMLHAVTGHTAAELVVARCDPRKANMGLTAWQGSRVRKGDIGTAKNYLNGEEIRDLNRIVTMFLDVAEDRAGRRKAMTMANWADELDRFLAFNDRSQLVGLGRVSHARMEAITAERFAVFDAGRRQAEADSADAEYEEELRTLASRLPTRSER